MGASNHSTEPDDLAAVRAALAGQAPSEPLVIDLRMSGGVESQRYRLVLRLAGDGKATCHLLDRLKDRSADGEAMLDGSQLSALNERLLATGVLELEEAGDVFPPDTVIGKLAFEYGDQLAYRVRFAPDPDQVPGYELPPAVGDAVDGLLELAATMLHIDEIGPRIARP